MRLATTLLILLPLASPAQTPQTSAAPTLQVYSRETIVDVTVTDAKGNPVHDLTPSDFTVKEDNKPQPIRSFTEYRSKPSAAQPELPPNVYTNQQPPPPSPALNILLLDGLNTAPPDSSEPSQNGLAFVIQTRVKQGAEKYLAAMPVGTRVAVLNLASNLRILQDFTSDPALLTASVHAMAMDMDGRAGTPQRDVSLSVATEQWCVQQNTRNRATLEALNQIASSFAGVKGKKNLLWFSLGFSTVVLQDVNAETKCLPDYAVDLHKTYALLSAAQVVVYPIGAQTPGQDVFHTQGPGQPITPSSPIPYSMAVSDEHMGLEQMAEATGGQAFYNSNDLAGLLGKAIAAGSDYYNLTYAPPASKYNGRHHAIAVELNRPGLTLTYRKEYWAEDPATIKSPAQLALTSPSPAATPAPPDMRVQMTRAMPTSDAVPFDVRILPAPAAGAETAAPAVIGVLSPKVKNKPLTRYTFDYSIPGQQIALAQLHGGLEFDLAAYDAEGSLVTSLREAVKLNYTAEQAAQLVTDSFLYTQQLDLPPGQLFLRVGVLDRTSNKSGTLEVPLTVPKR